MRYKRTVPIEKSNPLPPAIHSVDPLPEIPANVSAQRRAADAIKIAEKIYEFEKIYNITSNAQIRDDMYQKIGTLQDGIKSNRDKIIKLKRNAKYAQNCKERKLKILIENQEVIHYDKPGKPPFLFKYPDLHEYIHDCVEFGSADTK